MSSPAAGLITSMLLTAPKIEALCISAPIVNVSVPSPPSIVSSSLRLFSAAIVSLPAPPEILSMPSPVVIISLPAPPSITFPEPLTILLILIRSLLKTEQLVIMLQLILVIMP